MATFQSQVESYTGTVSDTTGLTGWLTNGARWIINLLPISKIAKHATDYTDTDGTTGISTVACRIIGAHKSGYPAKEIPPSMKGAAADTLSLLKATTKSPAFYSEGEKSYVLPSGGTIKGVTYPTVAYGDSAITNFPDDLEGVVAIYAAIQVRLAAVRSMASSLFALAWTTSSALPSDIAIESIAYSDATASSASASTVADILSYLPTFTPPTTLNGVTPGNLGSLALSLVGITAPTLPDDPAYSYSNAAVGTIAATTIATVATTPTYTKPTIDTGTWPANPSLTLDLSAITPPSVPNAPSYSYSSAAVGTIAATTITSTLTDPVYVAPTAPTFDDYTAVATALTAEDIELAQGHLAKLGVEIQHYSAKLNDSRATWENLMQMWQREVDVLVEQARLDQARLTAVAQMTTDVNEKNAAQTAAVAAQLYASTMEKYGLDLKRYDSMVQAAIAVFQHNLVGAQQIRESFISRYRADIENNANDFQKELAIYQALISNAIHQADLDQQRLVEVARMTTDVNEKNAAQTAAIAAQVYGDKLRRYAEAYTGYRAQVETKIGEYRANLEGLQTSWTAYLNRYEKDLLSNWDAFQAANASFDGRLKIAIANMQAAQEVAQLNAKNTTDVSVANKQAALSAAIAVDKAKLERLQSYIQRYAQEAQKEMARIQSLAQAYKLAHDSGMAEVSALRNEMMSQLAPYLPQKEAA